MIAQMNDYDFIGKIQKKRWNSVLVSKSGCHHSFPLRRCMVLFASHEWQSNYSFPLEDGWSLGQVWGGSAMLGLLRLGDKKLAVSARVFWKAHPETLRLRTELSCCEKWKPHREVTGRCSSQRLQLISQPTASINVQPHESTILDGQPSGAFGWLHETSRAGSTQTTCEIVEVNTLLFQVTRFLHSFM